MTLQKSRVKRVKRGWFDLGGAALGTVFGLATENDFKEVNDKLQKLRMVLSYQGKIAESQNNVLKSVIANLRKAENTTDHILTAINIVRDETTLFEHLSLIMDNLDIIIDQLHNIRIHYQTFMNGVTSAANGRITTNLLPVYNLKQIIEIGVKQYGLKPLFADNDITLYYAYLEATLTPDSILIHVPFITNDLFDLYQIYPFPSKINNTLFTIDSNTEMIMISNELGTVAFSSETDMESKCRSSLETLHLCPAYIFTFQPTNTVPCEMAIINNVLIDHHCTFTNASDKLIHHQRIGHTQFFYFTNNVSVYITCPDVQTTYTTASGLYSLPDYCSILTPSLSTRPTKNHYAILNHTHKFFHPLPNLHLNMSSHIKLTSPEWETMKLINQTLKPWENLNSEWLNPYFIYSPAPVVLVIFMIIIGLLLCAMYRMATRIENLENIIKSVNIRPT